MPDSHPFLSDDWMASARTIREEVTGGIGDDETPDVRMNQVITDVPFGEGTINLHMESKDGQVVMEVGHLDDPEVSVTVDYETAKAIFLDPTTAVQHFMTGRIKVQGDMTKLMLLMQAPTADPRAAEVQKRLAEITA